MLTLSSGDEIHLAAPRRQRPGIFAGVMEAPERSLEFGYNIGVSPLWLPVEAPVRKTERFKTYARKAGLVDHWRARGWPDLCHPTSGDDFQCN
jgi:hypothetical protein